MNMTLSGSLAIFGLALVLTELYLPELSRSLERGLDTWAERLPSIHRAIMAAPRRLNEWVSGTFIGRYYYRHHWKWFFAICALALVIYSVQVNSGEPWLEQLGTLAGALIVIPLVLVLLLTIPFGAYVYALFVLMVVCLLVSLPIIVLDRLLWAVNKIGKGKGLSGAGVMLALNDVLRHFV